MMNSPSAFSYSLPILLLLLAVVVSALISISGAEDTERQQTKRPSNNSISAILIFGDSTVDPGNNNYIDTAFRSNFPPYGRDFVNHIPTGRFTNGKLATDFIASYLRLKDNVPPYLDPTLSVKELMSGVSFASAGSGFDPLTPQISGVISIQRQLEYFREYKRKLEVAIGKKRTQNLIENAGIVVSAGTNDFIVNYYGIPDRRESYTVSSYVQFLMQHIQQLIQVLMDEGAKKIAFVGLPPMGCLPIVITLNSHTAFHQRQCVETLSSVARDYNRLLQNKLKAMQTNSTLIVYADIYDSITQMIQEPSKFGFGDVNTGCCGSGLFEAAYLCNLKSPVCSDASEYVFWDAIHPTERAYYNVFKALSSSIDYFLKK